MLVVAADESVMPQTREHFDICRLLARRRRLRGDDQGRRGRRRHARAGAARGEPSWCAGRSSKARPIVPGVGADRGGPRRAARGPGRGRCPAPGAARVRRRTAADRSRLHDEGVRHGRHRHAGGRPNRAGPRVRAAARRPPRQGARHPGARRRRRTSLPPGSAPRSTSAASSRPTSRRGETLAMRRHARRDAASRCVAGAAARSARPPPRGAAARPPWDGGGPRPVSIAGASSPRSRPERARAGTVAARGARGADPRRSVILRSYSPPLTIGAATVLDPAPAARGIRSEAGLRRLRELQRRRCRRRPSRRWCATAVCAACRSAMPWPAPGSRPSEVCRRRAATRGGRVARAGRRPAGVPRLRWPPAGEAVVALVRAFHAQHPISEGLPREEARARVFRGVDRAVFEAAMRRLVTARAIVDRERLALPSHKAALPGGEATGRAGGGGLPRGGTDAAGSRWRSPSARA